jgi:hypothetical protein
MIVSWTPSILHLLFLFFFGMEQKEETMEEWEEIEQFEEMFEATGDIANMDEQWFETTGDFTKKLNRLRSQINTLTQMESNPVKGQILNRIKQKELLLQSKTDLKKFASRIRLDPKDLVDFRVSSKKMDDSYLLLI